MLSIRKQGIQFKLFNASDPKQCMVAGYDRRRTMVSTSFV